MLGSSESRTEGGGGTNQVNHAVGEHAECRFPADFLEASSEESAAGGHSFYGSEGVFAGASPLADQVRIGLKTAIHSFQRVMQMAADKATPCGRAARLE